MGEGGVIRYFICLLLFFTHVATCVNVYAQTNELESAHKVAQTFMKDNPAHRLGWDWGQGVFLYGLHRLANVSKEKQPYINYLKKYFQNKRSSHPEINYPDRCPPGLTALALAQENKNFAFIDIAATVGNYIKTEDKNELGAIDHLGSHFYRHFYPDSIWVDSLMMYGIFSTRWSMLTNDKDLLDFSMNQPAIFADKLQDPETGLFIHSWNTKEKKLVPESKTFWLRGNGWVGASLVETLDHSPKDHPKRNEIIQILNRLMDGMLQFRGEDGLWESVINRKNYSYPETSGISLIGYAMAKGARLGYLPKNYLDIAKDVFHKLQYFIESKSSGTYLTYISKATNPSSAWMYSVVPTDWNISYGVGAYLLFASELYKADNE